AAGAQLLRALRNSNSKWNAPSNPSRRPWEPPLDDHRLVFAQCLCIPGTPHPAVGDSCRSQSLSSAVALFGVLVPRGRARRSGDTWMKWIIRILGGLIALVVLCLAALWLYGLRAEAGHSVGEIIIERPAAQVFVWLTDDERIKKWIGGLGEIHAVGTA